MSRENKPRKKRSFFGVFFSILGILILLALLCIVGGAAYIIRELGKDIPQTDDIASYIAAEPMTCAERFSFDDGMKVTIKLDKSDMWYYANILWTDYVPRMSGDGTEVAGFAIRGSALSTEDGMLRQDIVAGRENITVTGALLYSVTFSENGFVLWPEYVDVLGRRVPISHLEEKLKLDANELALDAEFGRSLTTGPFDVRLEDDAIYLTAQLDSDFPKYATRTVIDYNDVLMAFFPVGNRTYFYDIFDCCCGEGSGYERSLPLLKDDGGRIADYMNVLLELRGAPFSEELFAKNRGIISRFFKECPVDPERSASFTCAQECYRRRYDLDTMILDLQTEYKSGRLKFKDGEPLLDGEPLVLSDWLGENLGVYTAWFDPDECITVGLESVPGRGKGITLTVRLDDETAYVLANQAASSGKEILFSWLEEEAG